MLLEIGAVDMWLGETSWSPVVWLIPKAQNVSMEATVENFKALFEIVQCWLAEQDGDGFNSPTHT